MINKDADGRIYFALFLIGEMIGAGIAMWLTPQINLRSLFLGLGTYTIALAVFTFVAYRLGL